MLGGAQQANFAPRRDDSADAGDNDPGRLELRRYWSTAARRTRPATDRWVGLPRLGRVERTALLGDTQTGEQRDFMSSLRADAQGFAQGVRGHGGVETRRHGRLHVVFGDDASRLRTGTAPTLMTSSRHLGIKLFDQEPSALRLAKQRRQAAWNDDFYAKVLCG